MRLLSNLFERNRAWARMRLNQDSDFFTRLSRRQHPKIMWIGCSDSRVPANEIVGLDSGELFVHRNVGNLVVHTDMNCLSALQYAVELLNVEHVIVCGHYGCGGVMAAYENKQLGLIDNWLRNIKDVYQRHEKHLAAIPEEPARLARLCEFNVVQQVANLCHTTIVQNAWKRGAPLSVHGWIYGIEDGLLKDLDLCVSGPEQISSIYRMAGQAEVVR